jgi:hypothetical protein
MKDKELASHQKEELASQEGNSVSQKIRVIVTFKESNLFIHQF